MTEKLTEIDTPAWMLELFKAIDALDFDPNGGFKIFADDVHMQFGPKTVHGIEEVKKFFTKLDAPFITKHLVDRVFRFGTAYVMQGSAVLRKKDDPDGPELSAAPLFNILWLNEDGKLIRYVVDFDPRAAAKSDLF
jgi:hypothetical protein